jgi:phospholipid transport system substrate-binding protein
MKQKFALLLAASLIGSALAFGAEVVDPDVLIKNTVKEVLDVVHQDKDIREGNQKKILALVDAKVLPHFDFTRMTRLAVGRAWRTATPEQQKILEAEFRNLLVRTYTKAFTVYRDQNVEVKPFKMSSGATEVTVKTAIVQPGAQPIPVNYDMEKTDDGWKVYDLTVEGVSLVNTHRGSFAEKIQQAGIDGLIKSLIEMNQAAATAPVRKAETK